MAEQSTGQLQCEDTRCPRVGAKVWYCDDCNSTFCNQCWDIQVPHGKGKVARDDFPHEKTSREVVERLKAILNPPADIPTLQRMHEEDTETTWFSVDQNQFIDFQGLPRTEFVTQDHGRFGVLASELGDHDGFRSINPHLVAFVGETSASTPEQISWIIFRLTFSVPGAGKSTLIRMLLSLETSNGQDRDNIQFKSPVVGSQIHDKLPTSGDIHLYADPGTYLTKRPLLFADCEGLSGGSKVPLAKQAKQAASSGAVKSRVHNVFQSIQKPLQWAREDKNKQSREFAVTHFFPRLLYTFSDVVVFVMKDAK